MAKKYFRVKENPICFNGITYRKNEVFNISDEDRKVVGEKYFVEATNEDVKKAEKEGLVK